MEHASAIGKAWRRLAHASAIGKAWRRFGIRVNQDITLKKKEMKRNIVLYRL